MQDIPDRLSEKREAAEFGGGQARLELTGEDLLETSSPNKNHLKISNHKLPPDFFKLNYSKKNVWLHSSCDQRSLFR